MKNLVIATLALSLAAPLPASAFLFGSGSMEKEPVRISNLTLEGEIEGENIVFTLSFNAQVNRRGASMPLVVGDVAFLGGELPRKSTLKREENRYLLEFDSTGQRAVTFRFAGRAGKSEEWRHTGFTIPMASIRKLSVICDRDDLKVRFPGALSVERSKAEDGRTMASAFLGISDTFQVQWKPEVKKLAAELAVSCEANTIATASVGALRLDTVLTYRVIQGSLTELSLDLPPVNITQVTGPDIQNWRIDRSDPQHPRLQVALSRPKEDVYRFRIESEMILPAFPCKFDLPVMAPRNVIRSSGFLMVGADSAIKLGVDRLSGLTQIDQASFRPVLLGKEPAHKRPAPRRSAYAYQYAGMPYTLTLNADDVVTSFTADDRLVLSFENGELAFNASVEIDVKDAPAREIFIETDPDPGWTVTAISGAHVAEADTDVREENGMRLIPVRNSSSWIAGSLRHGRIVTFLADQDAHQVGVFVPFLGRPASTPIGPALFSWKIGSPMVISLLLPLDDDRWEVLFHRVPRPETTNRDEFIRQITGYYTEFLERQVRTAPEHWFWPHRRWKTAPPE